TTDWPISTLEAWLQRQISETEVAAVMAMPMDELSAIARPEQQYVVSALAERIGFDLNLSYADNQNQAALPEPNTVEEAYHVRLQMELTNVGAEDQVKNLAASDQTDILNKLVSCEAGHWK
ncbi:MAG: Caspase domain-containing protein, partial [Phormidesmis sp.]